MAGWDGRGLPPAASARMRRFADDGVRTSLLSVPDAASLDAAGLVFVGEVMGCMVQQIVWTGTGVAGGGLPTTTRFVDGKAVTTARAQPTVSTSSDSSWAGFGPYVRALYDGYRTAIARMVTEAVALGAVGVVGASVTRTPVGGHSWEFLAMGTAVRDASGARVDRPFVTDLSGARVAQALSSGWVPVSVAIGISVAVVGGGVQTWQQLSRQTRRWAPNSEVVAYSELATQVRSDARNQFAAEAARAGADAAVVSSMDFQMVARTDQQPVPVGQAVVIGSTLASFSAAGQQRPRPLSVLPLRGARRPTQEDA